MSHALWLLAVQGAIGAFDTFYYHEWKARLPARGKAAAAELKLHAGRDLLYAVVAAEIVLTLWDFVAEIRVRKELGDVYAGERVTHAVMGISYGGMLAFLMPVLNEWWALPTALAFDPPPTIPEFLRGSLSAMALGVFLSGLRDLYASLELPHGGWPWETK